MCKLRCDSRLLDQAAPQVLTCGDMLLKKKVDFMASRVCLRIARMSVIGKEGRVYVAFVGTDVFTYGCRLPPGVHDRTPT